MAQVCHDFDRPFAVLRTVSDRDQGHQGRLAAGGQFDTLATRLATQLLLQDLFKTFLADLEAGRDEQRIAVLLVILGRGRASSVRARARSRGLE